MKKIVLSLSLFLFCLLATHGQNTARQNVAEIAQQRYVQKVDLIVTLSKLQKSELNKAYGERSLALEPLKGKKDKQSLIQKIEINRIFYLKEQEILNPTQKQTLEQYRGYENTNSTVSVSERFQSNKTDSLNNIK